MFFKHSVLPLFCTLELSFVLIDCCHQYKNILISLFLKKKTHIFPDSIYCFTSLPPFLAMLPEAVVVYICCHPFSHSMQFSNHSNIVHFYHFPETGHAIFIVYISILMLFNFPEAFSMWLIMIIIFGGNIF